MTLTETRETYELVVAKLAKVDHWDGTGGGLDLGGSEGDELSDVRSSPSMRVSALTLSTLMVGRW